MEDRDEVRWELEEDEDPPRLVDRGLPEKMARVPLGVWMGQQGSIAFELIEQIISEILDILDAADAKGARGVWMCPGNEGRVVEIEISSDTHGLGCILYTLVTGKAPFPQVESAARAEAIATGTYAPVEVLRPDTPANVRATIFACLAPDPARRPASLGAIDLLLAGTRDVNAPDPVSAASASAPVEYDEERERREAAEEWMGKGAGAGGAPRIVPVAVAPRVETPAPVPDAVLDKPRVGLGVIVGATVGAGVLLAGLAWLVVREPAPPEAGDEAPKRAAAAERASATADVPAPAAPLKDDTAIAAMTEKVLAAGESEVLACRGAGTWELGFTLTPEGKATMLRVIRTDKPDDAVQVCIAMAIAGWRFEPIAHSYPVTRTYTF